MKKKLKKYVFLLVLVTGMVVFSGDYPAAEDGQVSPRIFTPNDDGVNDEVNFVFPNPDPKETSQGGRIYDIQGHRICDLVLTVTNEEIRSTWGGVDLAGEVVRSGIYIYQIEISSTVFNGTVILAK